VKSTLANLLCAYACMVLKFLVRLTSSQLISALYSEANEDTLMIRLSFVFFKSSSNNIVNKK